MYRFCPPPQSCCRLLRHGLRGSGVGQTLPSGLSVSGFGFCFDEDPTSMTPDKNLSEAFRLN